MANPNVPNQGGNPNNPQAQQQGKPQLAPHHQQALQAAGINWQNIPWSQLIGIIQALLAALAAQQQGQPGQAPHQP